MLYSVYGIHLESTVVLDSLVPDGGYVPDISYVEHGSGPKATLPPGATLSKRSPLSIGGYVSQYTIGDTHLLRFEGRADFAFAADGSMIECWAEPGFQAWARVTLGGLALSFALFLKGVGSLHAAAVTVGNGAIGLVAVPGTGKSTLATSLAIAGHRLLSDDVLVLHREGEDFLVGEGPRHVGLQPSALNRLKTAEVPDGSARDDKKVRIPLEEYWSGAERVPLRAVYLLSRDDSVPHASIQDLSKAEGLKELLKHTPPLEFLLQTVFESYWTFLGEVVDRVPVRRLRYPSGFDRLPEIGLLLSRADVGSVA